MSGKSLLEIVDESIDVAPPGSMHFGKPFLQPQFDSMKIPRSEDQSACQQEWRSEWPWKNQPADTDRHEHRANFRRQQSKSFAG
jgi:hypothetical protein